MNALPSPPAGMPADARAAALALALWRSDCLRELGDIAVATAREVMQGARRDPANADRLSHRFCKIARIVRLIAIMGMWVWRQIGALTRGEAPPAWESWQSRRREKPRAAGAAQETGDKRAPAEERRASDASRERGDVFVFATWNEAVGHICKVLGVADASRFLQPSLAIPRVPADDPSPGRPDAPLPAATRRPLARSVVTPALCTTPPPLMSPAGVLAPHPPPHPPPMNRKARRLAARARRRAGPQLS